MKVIIDTNALMYAAENKLDLFQMLKGNDLIIPNLVLDELRVINRAAKKASDKKAAFLAIKILEFTSFKIVHLAGKTDDAIGKYALYEDAAVLTNDLILKRKLAKVGVRVMHIRQRKLVEVWT
jgi:rRNA-processing protein FCF1